MYSPLNDGERYNENKSPPKDKNTLLAEIATKEGVEDKRRVFLLDDDGRNVAAARRGGFSASVVEKPGLGMSIQLFLRYLGQE